MTVIHKVADLIGWRLDLAVAIAEGATRWSVSETTSSGPKQLFVGFDNHPTPYEVGHRHELTLALSQFHPSREWFDGGPIIERERISTIDFTLDSEGSWWAGYKPLLQAMSGMEFDGPQQFGPTALVAAMRAFLLSRYGETLELPA